MTALATDYYARRLQEEGGHREIQGWKEYDSSLGQRRSVRRHAAPELFRAGISADILEQTSWRPPDYLRVAFEEVLGKEPKYMLRMHPLFNRVCAFERFNVGGHGQYYAVFSMFHEEVEHKDALPSDYVGDPRKAHMRGMVGEFKMPTKRDFELIRNIADRQTLGNEGVDAALEEFDKADEREKEREAEDVIHDMLDYGDRAIINDANRKAGSGWNMMSTPTVEHKPDNERWVRVKLDGIWQRARRGSRMGDELEMRAAEEKAARLKAEAARLDHIEGIERRRLAMRAAQEAALGTGGRKRSL